MTNQVVSLKVFRLKAKVIRRAIVPHVVEETAASRSNYGFTIRRIPVFPNSLQPYIYLPDQVLIFNTSIGMKKQIESLNERYGDEISITSFGLRVVGCGFKAIKKKVIGNQAGRSS